MISQNHLNGKRAVEGMKLLTNIIYHMKQIGVNDIPADIQAIYAGMRYESLACGSDISGLANKLYSGARRIESPKERKRKFDVFYERISAEMNRAQEKHYKDIKEKLGQVGQIIASAKDPCDIMGAIDMLENIRQSSPYSRESFPPATEESRRAS